MCLRRACLSHIPSKRRKTLAFQAPRNSRKWCHGRACPGHPRRPEWGAWGIELFVQIGQFRIEIENEADLPGARPMFRVALALDRIADVGESFIADESIEPVAFRRTFEFSRAVVPDPLREIARDTDQDHPDRHVGDDIGPSAAHFRYVHRVDGRDKPGHDGACACAGRACRTFLPSDAKLSPSKRRETLGSGVMAGLVPAIHAVPMSRSQALSSSYGSVKFGLRSGQDRPRRNYQGRA